MQMEDTTPTRGEQIKTNIRILLMQWFPELTFPATVDTAEKNGGWKVDSQMKTGTWKWAILTACAAPQKECAVLEELPARSASADGLSWKWRAVFKSNKTLRHNSIRCEPDRTGKVSEVGSGNRKKRTMKKPCQPHESKMKESYFHHHNSSGQNIYRT